MQLIKNKGSIFCVIYFLTLRYLTQWTIECTIISYDKWNTLGSIRVRNISRAYIIIVRIAIVCRRDLVWNDCIDETCHRGFAAQLSCGNGPRADK